MTRSTRDRQAVAEVFLSVLVARSPTGFGTEPAACVRACVRIERTPNRMEAYRIRFSRIADRFVMDLVQA